MSVSEKFSSGRFHDASAIIVWPVANIQLACMLFTETFSHASCTNCMLIKHISMCIKILLAQQFSSIHAPSGTSFEMDLNGHSESPVRGIIALLFLWGGSESISVKYELPVEHI